MNKEEKEGKKTEKKRERSTARKIEGGMTEEGMTDYKVYSMNFLEMVTGFAIGFVVGAVMLYVFFRIWILSGIVGLITGVAGIILYRKRLCTQRQKRLLMQFRDLMESLVASYSIGRNTTGAFIDAREDLEKIYGVESDIVQELDLIKGGMNSGMRVEEMLHDLGERSNLEDISNFAMIFEVKGSGIDLKTLVAETQEIIGDKIEMEQQIETMITSEKSELYIMLVMPFIMMLAFSAFSEGDMMANTPANILAKLVGIILFVLAYLMGSKIMDIRT